MKDDDPDSTKLVLIRIRLAYAMGLFRPKAFEAGQQPKYGCTCLLPPGHPQQDKVEPKLQLAAKLKFGLKRQKLRGLSTDPVLKSVADFENLQTADVGADWSFIRVASLEPPAIVDAKLNPIAASDLLSECYSGRWADVSLNAYGYERKTGDGVTFGVNGVKLTKHDKRLGRSAPKDDFDPEELPDDDNDGNDDDLDDNDDLKPASRPRRR